MKDALVQAYEHHGYAVVKGCLEAHTVQHLIADLETRSLPPSGLLALSVEHDPVAADLVASAELMELATQVLGDPVVAFGMAYVVKPPSSSRGVAWHQDGHPWKQRWGITRAVTLWVALDAADVHNGALRVVPGSHRQPLEPLEAVDGDHDVFGWRSPAHLVDETGSVTLTMGPGDVSLHHPALVHGSEPNRSRRRRAALSIRFRADEPHCPTPIGPPAAARMTS